MCIEFKFGSEITTDYPKSHYSLSEYVKNFGIWECGALTTCATVR